MSKKDFIALADAIREANKEHEIGTRGWFDGDHLQTLADFCAQSGPRFKRERWLDYIAGKCGPNGGKV